MDLAASAGEFDEVGLDVDDLVAQAESLSKELKARVTDSGSTLMDLPGIGPIVAARVLADVGDVTGSPTATAQRAACQRSGSPSAGARVVLRLFEGNGHAGVTERAQHADEHAASVLLGPRNNSAFLRYSLNLLLGEHIEFALFTWVI